MNLRCPAPKKEGKMRIRAFPVSFQLFIFFLHFSPCLWSASCRHEQGHHFIYQKINQLFQLLSQPQQISHMNLGLFQHKIFLLSILLFPIGFHLNCLIYGLERVGLMAQPQSQVVLTLQELNHCPCLPSQPLSCQLAYLEKTMNYR